MVNSECRRCEKKFQTDDAVVWVVECVLEMTGPVLRIIHKACESR